MKDYIQIGIDRGLMSLNEDKSQMEIATHVYELSLRAKNLQEEGKQMLEEAKQKVERMILNEKNEVGGKYLGI